MDGKVIPRRENYAGVQRYVARAGMAIGAWTLLTTALIWGGPEVSRTELSPAAARELESKIQILSGGSSADATSYQPIVITDGEANSYLKYHIQQLFPPGVHNPEVHIAPARVFASANVDFDEFSRATSSASNWGPKVLAAMFKGKQRVAAAGRLETQKGQGKVKIETVVVGTTTVPDWLVDFVLENYIQPRYKLDLSKPFELPDHVTSIELRSGQATFIRSPNKAR
jgi:hypothetical protein